MVKFAEWNVTCSWLPESGYDVFNIDKISSGRWYILCVCYVSWLIWCLLSRTVKPHVLWRAVYTFKSTGEFVNDMEICSPQVNT